MKIKERLLKLLLLSYLHFIVANLHLIFGMFGSMSFFINYWVVYHSLTINPVSYDPHLPMIEYVKAFLGIILSISILINIFSLLKDLYSKKA